MTCCISFRPLKSLCAFFVVIATALSTHGELPPSVYKDLQEKSPEALTIKVESVRISTTDEPTLKRLTITAETRVETVIRSASGSEALLFQLLRYLRFPTTTAPKRNWPSVYDIIDSSASVGKLTDGNAGGRSLPWAVFPPTPLLSPAKVVPSDNLSG
jgi:hypothetical protein